MSIPGDIDRVMTARPAPAGKPGRIRRRPRTAIDPADACPACGDYLNVRWRGRGWCIICDERELFGRER